MTSLSMVTWSRSQTWLGNADDVPKLSLGCKFVPKYNLGTR